MLYLVTKIQQLTWNGNLEFGLLSPKEETFNFPKFLEPRYQVKWIPEKQRGGVYPIFGSLFGLPYNLNYISVFIFFCSMVIYDLMISSSSAISENTKLCLEGMTPYWYSDSVIGYLL